MKHLRLERIPAWLWFFGLTLALRISHSLLTLNYHVDGDIALPWLMANDWATTLHKDFFWGQTSMRTFEVAALARIGHLLFGKGNVIPFWLGSIFGNLEYVAGAAFIYAGLVGIDAKRWVRPSMFGLCVALFGFSAPVFQKYAFDVGYGYSSLPIASGISLYLGLALPRGERSWISYLAGGALLGFSVYLMRLAVVPFAALIAVLILLGWSEGKEWIRSLGWLLLGGVLGGLPDILSGLARNSPGGISLLPIATKVQNLFETLHASGSMTGLLPDVWFTPEDALFFRGHMNYPSNLLKIISAVVLVIWLGLAIRRFGKNKKVWILFATIGVNYALLVLSDRPLDNFMARRYAFPAFFAISVLILLDLPFLLNRVLASARVAGLATYLLFSLTYQTPIREVASLVRSRAFDAGSDCLAGFGGDLPTIAAFSGIIPKMIDSTNWRLTGNFSKAIDPGNPAIIARRCSKVFFLETGEAPVSVASPYCNAPRPIFIEHPSLATQYRPAVKVYECDESKVHRQI